MDQADPNNIFLVGVLVGAVLVVSVVVLYHVVRHEVNLYFSEKHQHRKP